MNDAYNYEYSTSSSGDAAAAAVGITVILLVFAIIAVTYIVSALALQKIFKKANVEPSWAAWVPIYNSWKFLEMGGQAGFWAVLGLVPLVNIVYAVFMLVATYKIGEGFGKGGAFFIVALFLPIVWLLWLAFDKTAVWQNSHIPPTDAIPPNYNQPQPPQQPPLQTPRQ